MTQKTEIQVLAEKRRRKENNLWKHEAWVRAIACEEALRVLREKASLNLRLGQSENQPPRH